ncbi:MAG TPA: bifunctional DNA-formamidopyrimidine glycosylase/DNA-(apurinic or apyrimidinic site) lyase, partial [Bryobacteraceae bacterium]|nr:bifunctional DNA-formamidopyrimidine glycosylase/DNA-(apurinic or apyrimidinic site) lyase [Bryobacteraceae bacterium]
EGRRILSAEFLNQRVLRHCVDPNPESLQGRRIVQVRRRGKHIVMQLDEGVIIIHLGMTGKLLINAPRSPHTRAIFTLEGVELSFEDIRTFGSIEWTTCTIPERMERLGPEPFDITPDEFFQRLKQRKTSIKALLMNQTLVRGMGNIYVDEALFRARIHPATQASRLSRVRADRLHAAMLDVLRAAIGDGGSSISDYVDGEGRRGSFQDRHAVYGREGKPCISCGTPIRKIVLAQRGTHFCPRCQR